MAILAGSDQGGRGRRRQITSLSEINVTPFVDVLLVLLVIFMLTASVMEFGIEVDVPKVRTQRDSSKELPVVSVTKAGELFLNDKAVKLVELPQVLQTRFKGQKQAYVRADREATFELVAQVLAELGDAGIGVNVVTKPLAQTGRK